MGQGCYKKIFVNRVIVAFTTDEMFTINFTVTTQDCILGIEIFY